MCTLPTRDVLRVARQHGATSVRVFGSWARGDQTATSDLDLLVDLDPGRSLLDLIAIKQDLEDLLNCPVEVVTVRSLPPSLRERVLAEAIPLAA
jgi:predicted nucleotidyltransferase